MLHHRSFFDVGPVLPILDVVQLVLFDQEGSSGARRKAKKKKTKVSKGSEPYYFNFLERIFGEVVTRRTDLSTSRRPRICLLGEADDSSPVDGLFANIKREKITV